MICYDFSFNGEKLSDYGFVIGGVDSNGRTWSGGDVTFNSVKPPNLDKFKYYSYTYETPLSCTFSVVNIDCKHQDRSSLLVTQKRQSALMRWLMREDGYHWFNFIKDGFNDVFYNVYFISEPMIDGDDVIGFNLTITSDSPYAYSDEIVFEDTLQAGRDMFIYNNSDQIGYILPYVEITPKQNGKLVMKSGHAYADFTEVYDENDNRLGVTINDAYRELYVYKEPPTDIEYVSTTVIEHAVKNSKIRLDESNDYYYGVLGDNFNFVFPRLATTYDHKVSVLSIADTSDVTECDVLLKYRKPKRVVV